MSRPAYVLDTDIISYLMQRELSVRVTLAEAIAQGAIVLLCPVVHYEIMRGLLHHRAPRKLAAFERLSQTLEHEPLDMSDWECAARLWSEACRRGRPTQDADLLIAAYAIGRDAILVTNNTRHFEHLPVKLENWLETHSSV